MTKRKYPRLANGFGSIRKLSGKRSNPFAVFAPAKEYNNKGNPIYKKALAYTNTWNKAFSVLCMYHAGTWQDGAEIPEAIPELPKNELDIIVSDIMRKLAPAYISNSGLTFKEVYEMFFNYKFKQNKKEYSKSTIRSIVTAFKNCEALHSRAFNTLRYKDLQEVVDLCRLKHSSKELIVNLLKQLYNYAEAIEVTDKNHARHLKIKTADDDIHGVPFNADELQILWEHKDNEIARLVLIMCYSGFRVNEYANIKINLNEQYFLGGSKTAAGKNRIVPIHSGIYVMVRNQIEDNGCIINSANRFRRMMYSTLKELKIEKHTPHDCRHTFAMLCDKYGVNEVIKKRMLGHSFQDVTNKIYGHSDLNTLKKEIEKIVINCY